MLTIANCPWLTLTQAHHAEQPATSRAAGCIECVRWKPSCSLILLLLLLVLRRFVGVPFRVGILVLLGRG